jgi:hypothetical protein
LPIAEMADDASRKVAASDSFIVVLRCWWWWGTFVVFGVCCLSLDGFPKNKNKI